MIYACIKENIIRNVIEASEEFVALYITQGGYDTFVLLKHGYGIGDKYYHDTGEFVKVCEGESELDVLKSKLLKQELVLAEQERALLELAEIIGGNV